MNNKSNCKICGNSLSGKQQLYCSPKCKNQAHQSYPSQKLRGIRRKLYFVELLGGRCNKCGYNTNISALAFHHKDGKEFQLDVRSLSNRKLESIVKEVNKCVLLCHNCHAETHNPDLDLATLLN